MYSTPDCRRSDMMNITYLLLMLQNKNWSIFTRTRSWACKSSSFFTTLFSPRASLNRVPFSVCIGQVLGLTLVRRPFSNENPLQLLEKTSLNDTRFLHEFVAGRTYFVVYNVRIQLSFCQQWLVTYALPSTTSRRSCWTRPNVPSAVLVFPYQRSKGRTVTFLAVQN